MDYKLTDWLPTTKKELKLRGWDYVDIILFSGDAYVDHPSFGAAVVGRLFEAEGFRVAIVPQPDWHGDFRDFTKLGRPRMFFSIAPGCMDSMVNNYTAARRLRSEDAYSPDGRHDMRPEYPTIVYTQILKRLYPDVPVVIGGIEASLRRRTHFDYWQNRLRPSILVDSGADLLVYGMGELPLQQLCASLLEHLPFHDEDYVLTLPDFKRVIAAHPVLQTAVLVGQQDIPGGIKDTDILLASHEEAISNPKAHAKNFRHIEEESNKLQPQRLLQAVGGRYVVVAPPFPPMTTQQIDRSFAFPYTRLPHPKYDGKRIPAYDMIKFSVNIHRGCFGGCSFCTISAHQGKFIMSRSKQSILDEVKKVIAMPGFKGYLSDLGGPSANMYAMSGRNLELCKRCARPSCIHPNVCKNLNSDHRPLLEVYKAVDALPGIKRSFIGSGVRYDLLLHRSGNQAVDAAADEYTQELIEHHVSGRLKVAPEHTSPSVLKLMRKPNFEQFHEFRRKFMAINKACGLNQQIIPYFISSHPGCTATDMAELAALTRKMDFRLEQVQDFTPTPMTVSTTAWATGYHPYTLEPVFSAKNPADKLRQRMFFFWYQPEQRAAIIAELRKMGRPDLIEKLYGSAMMPHGVNRGEQPRRDEKQKRNKGKRRS